MHLQTQEKIERGHQTLKKLHPAENYYLPSDLEAQIQAFIDHYNHQCYHESLGNVTSVDAYFGRAHAIVNQRQKIKIQTLHDRRLLFYNQAA